MDIRELLALSRQRGASDLHLVESEPPILRINGKLIRTNHYTLHHEELEESIFALLSEEQRATLEKRYDVNCSISLPGTDRFRLNVHRQGGFIEAAFRRFPVPIPQLEELGLPKSVHEFITKPHGLVLVVGAAGTGKSTTLTAMVDRINSEHEALIITIEDPVEYLHKNKKGVIKQREIGADTTSFAEALRNALRQDPNVIVIGEMRDFETISTALTAAETGHLVLATLHTGDAVQTIERIIDVFPPTQQSLARQQLANTLQGVVAQQLLPRADGKGRVLASEVLIATAAVRNLIRENRLELIRNTMQTGTRYGMCTIEWSLKDLQKQGVITQECAMAHLNDDELYLRM